MRSQQHDEEEEFEGATEEEGLDLNGDDEDFEEGAPDIIEVVQEPPPKKPGFLARLRDRFRRKPKIDKDLLPVYAVLADHAATFNQIVQSFNNVTAEVIDELNNTKQHVAILENTILKMLNVDVYVCKAKGAYSVKKNNPTDAAYDVYALSDTVIKAGERGLVDTGLIIAIPAYCVGRIWGRSGINANLASAPKKARNIEAYKAAVESGGELPALDLFPNHLTTHIGTVDPGYRDYWRVVLENGTGETIVIKRGDSIAQIDVMVKPNLTFIEVDSPDDLPASDGRDKKAFASSGVTADQQGATA